MKIIVSCGPSGVYVLFPKPQKKNIANVLT